MRPIREAPRRSASAAIVRRASIGFRSACSRSTIPRLQALGRIHSVAEGRAAIELARETFPRLSFDLIYARPGQTLRAWEAELKAAIGLAADHLSLYQLTIEPETPFFRLHEAGKLKVPPPPLAAEFYALTQEVTDAAGLPAYEISNHAAPGAESRHNLTYWRYQDYVGVGPGAHGRLSVDGTQARHDEREASRALARKRSSARAMGSSSTRR